MLETDIKDLKQMMTGQLQEMENKSQKFREDQFRQLVSLLKQERQQKEELLRQVTRLDVENKTLKRVGMMLKQKLMDMSASPPQVGKNYRFRLAREMPENRGSISVL